MTHQQFKKEAAKLNREVYSIRRKTNSFTGFFTVTYSYIIGENTVSTQQICHILVESYEEILYKWENVDTIEQAC